MTADAPKTDHLRNQLLIGAMRFLPGFVFGLACAALASSCLGHFLNGVAFEAAITFGMASLLWKSQYD